MNWGRKPSQSQTGDAAATQTLMSVAALTASGSLTGRSAGVTDAPPSATKPFAEETSGGQGGLAAMGCLAVLLTACGADADRSAADTARAVDPTPGRIEFSPLPEAVAAADGETLFELLPPEHTGIDFQLRWDDPAAFIREFLLLNPCGGVATGDYDGDALPDVYVTSPSGGNRLFRNAGDFRFEDATDEAGVADPDFWGTGASFVDIDGDGDLDLFACAYARPNRMFVNDGTGKFKDRAAEMGLDFNGASMMMSFADIDGDGDLDGYLATTGIRPPAGTEFRVRFEPRESDGVEVPVIPEHLQEVWELLYLPGDRVQRVEAGQFDRLYRNDGGKFVEVASESGIVGAHFTLAATWWDYDEDGDADLYVANDYTGPDRLYRNRGDGTFEDVAPRTLPHTPWFSMGCDVGDIDGDGRLDLFASDMSATTHYRDKMMMGNMDDMGWFLELPVPRQYMRNAVYLNPGSARLREGAYLLGAASTNWTWTPRLEDFDADGFVDAFVTNGVVRDNMNSDLTAVSEMSFAPGSPEYAEFWLRQPMRKERNVALRNTGKLKFDDVGSAWGLDREGVSYGAATADFDRDGDVDIIVSNADAPVSIYRNRSAGNRRAVVELRGSASNAQGLGAVVRVQAGGREQVRWITLARGFQSASEPIACFGLGDAERIERLEVTWPGGARQEFAGLPADHRFVVHEAVGQPLPPAPDEPDPLFAPTDALAEAVHRERPYDDFAAEPLLPNRQSQLGPPSAWADIDDDGDDDFFLGGAAGSAGSIFRNDGEGSFVQLEVSALDAHRESEDAAAVFFDADGDGDADLLVGSGGVEAPEDDASYRDRLYLNDGRGSFAAAPNSALPDRRTSTSAAVACDFDRDGDVDVFLGSRATPGRYPVPQPSALLVNGGDGTFAAHDGALTDDLGIVTSALWSDANGDGWLDLLVAVEWGSVRIFLNSNGRLAEATEAAGVAARRGWWNGITGGDIDADGDTDYVVTNFGLNTKYKASPEKPELLYFGDFDGTGRPQIVEAKFEGDTLLPRRGFSCSQQAMPFLREKLRTFHNFASSSLVDIYSEPRIDEALELTADTLESGILINDGSATFDWRPLPRIAQIAPSFGSALIDADADGDLDLALAQNFFSPQRETGRMDGGLGELLINDGAGNFSAPGPAVTGILAAGDSKSLTAADVTGDGRPDLVLGAVDAPVNAFARTGGEFLQVRLTGDAAGARVTVGHHVWEVYAGSGYRSQNPPVLWVPKRGGNQNISVRWPDGSTTEHSAGNDSATIAIVRPQS